LKLEYDRYNFIAGPNYTDTHRTVIYGRLCRIDQVHCRDIKLHNIRIRNVQCVWGSVNIRISIRKRSVSPSKTDDFRQIR